MRRPPATAADYLLVGINPALIMVLIASLVFFLLEIFYRGEYGLRLNFIFAMFIMGAVAVGRLSMEEGTGYATMFGAPLALVVLIAISSFVKFQGMLAPFSFALNILLIALIWWLAYQLTWDCTLLDERADTSDQGLLEAAGLQDDGRPESTAEDPIDLLLTETDSPREELPAWLKWFERSKKPHAHGVWVIYFSLAALPLFSLGQAFLPGQSRNYAFFLLVTYVATALALLLSTSFLGLRRYLRKRRLEMPLEMTTTWLGVGGVLIAAVLLICMFLPRPGAELAVSQLPAFTLTSPDRSPSRVSVGNDGQKHDEHASASGKGKEEPAEQTGKSQASRDEGQGSQGQGEQSEGKSSGGQQNEGKQQEGKSDQSNQGGNQKSQGDPSGNKSNGQNEQKSGGQGQQKSNNGSPSEGKSSGEQSGQPSQQQQPSEQQSSNQASQPQSQQSPSSPTQTPSTFSPTTLFASLGNLLKLLLYLAIFAVLAFLAWKYREQLIAAWRQLLKELRELWERLFGGSEAAAKEAASAAPAVQRRPFASYANPFATGQAARIHRTELVRYTFEALQAYGREHGCLREESETPHEYVQRMAMSSPHLAREAAALADYYGMAAYAGAALPSSFAEPLRSLWQKMQQPVPIGAA